MEEVATEAVTVEGVAGVTVVEAVGSVVATGGDSVAGGAAGPGNKAGMSLSPLCCRADCV